MYSFGICLLEMATGRPVIGINSRGERKNLLTWVRLTT